MWVILQNFLSQVNLTEDELDHGAVNAFRASRFEEIH